MDADGDIDPRAIRPSLALMELYEPDIVLGSKRHPLSEVSYPTLRRLLSWTYHKLCRLLFRVNVRDTQTGLKLIRRDVLATVLPRMLEKRYAFDLELLVVARRLGFRRVLEAPVRIDYRFSSQVNMGAAFHILLDTMAIFYRRYVLNTYRWDLHPIGVEDRIPSGPVIGADGLAAAPVVPQIQRGDGHLRILFLNWRDIRNPEAGGAEIFTHEVAKRWVEWGHEVSLLTSRFRGSTRAETVDGVRIRRMGRLRNGTFHLLVQRELRRLRGFDVVIDEINTIPFLTPLWRGRLPPAVALIHQLAVEVWDAEVPRPLAALGRRIEPRLLGLYRDIPIVTVSESTKQDLNRLGLDRVSVIPQGRDQPPDLNGLTKEPVPTFLFVGRLAPNKRPDHAVEAFQLIRQEFPEARLWIVGQGPLETRLRANLSDGAEMLGYVPRRELYERMARAHCLLICSVREGWGMVVTEANAMGTPAIGYDVPGIRDSIRHGETGLLVAAGKPAALSREAVSLLSDSSRYRMMHDRALDWAHAFSWEATAERLMSLIERHLRDPSASPTIERVNHTGR
jgi:glycosyltransferase involved in cell wall biosynthesis